MFSTIFSSSDSSDKLIHLDSSDMLNDSDKDLPEERSFQQEMEEWTSSNRARHYHINGSSYANAESLDIMNMLCMDIHKEYEFPPDQLLSFRSINQLRMNGGLRENLSQPDVVASTAAAFDATGIHWSGVDAVVEVASERRRGRDEHAISHVVQLLEARPDLVCASGFHVDTDGILLIIGSPSSILLSPKLSPSVEQHIRLLAAFVKRMYMPHPLMIDPTIHRRLDVSGNAWVFDIALAIPEKSDIIHCTGYSILSSHRSIGERSHVFQNTHSPAMVNGVPMPIIKDHYRHPDNTHSEAEVLRHIQAEGMFPGVVEMVYSTDKVLREDKSLVSSGMLVKARIGLRQFGTSFMDLKTPREALMAIYDLLEVTRVLYQCRGVMHRNISDGNVLLVSDDCESPPLHQQPISGTSYPVCFSRYILSKSDDPSRTNVLLIGFDQSVIITNPESPIPKQRLATRRFIARAVDGRRPIDTYNTLWAAPPDMESDVRERYANVHAERLKRFTYSSAYHFVRPPRNPKPESGHRLWHEAESAFFLLYWWAIRAQPSTTSSPSYIPPMVWNVFQSNGSFSRRVCTVDDGALDPLYEPMEDLLQCMGGVIHPDLRWASAKPYTEPDFLHDTLQRHIINFLVLNDKASFMDVAKAQTRRVCNEKL